MNDYTITIEFDNGEVHKLKGKSKGNIDADKIKAAVAFCDDNCLDNNTKLKKFIYERKEK